MPLFDRTGPQGFGSRTGRGFGPCGIGFDLNKKGYGRGRGFRFWNTTPSKEEIKQDLDQYQKYLEEELGIIKTEKKRLEEEK